MTARNLALAHMIFFLVGAPFALAVEPLTECGAALSNDASGNISAELTPTGHLTSYIDFLLTEGVLDDLDLRGFVESLERGAILNPVIHISTRNAHTIHHDQIQRILDHGGLDVEQLLNWTKTRLTARSVREKTSGQTREKTQSTIRPFDFQRVPSGEFTIPIKSYVLEGLNHRLVGIHRETVRLTHPIEVMRNLVTQEQWVSLMGANPSVFVAGDEGQTATINGQPVQLRSDHPVENLSWWSALVFANRLSELHGFAPAYDLTKIPFGHLGPPEWKAMDPTETLLAVAARGELGPQSIFDESLRINAPEGDIYRAQGYRLPTVAEQAWLLAASGFEFSDDVDIENNQSTVFEGDPAGLLQHASFDAKMQETSAVGLLQPHYVGGKPFYDLIGNVAEFSHDSATPLRGGTNPNPIWHWNGRSAFGGPGGQSFGKYHLSFRDFFGSDYRSSHLGLRLVRTIE